MSAGVKRFFFLLVGLPFLLEAFLRFWATSLSAFPNVLLNLSS
jgi:hypothetical protein